MSTFRNRIAQIVTLALVICTSPLLLAQNTVVPPDSTLYTNYELFDNLTTVLWSVCGQTQQTDGCYGSGRLGPFGQVGAMVEGIAFINGNTVTRGIYVIDSASGSSGNGVELYIYKKVDVVSESDDIVTVTLERTLNLPLIGGTSALVSMAANTGFLFIGTDQSPQAVRVQKNNLAITPLGGFSPPINVTAITANGYGYVTVTQGGFGGGDNGFSVYAPNGEGEGDGGGADFMLNTRNAVQTNILPTSKHPVRERAVRWKASAESH